MFRFADTARQEEWAAERPIVQAQDTVSTGKPTNSGVTEGTAACRKAWEGERGWPASKDSYREAIRRVSCYRFRPAGEARSRAA